MTRPTKIILGIGFALATAWNILDLPPLMGPFVGLGLFMFIALVIVGIGIDRSFNALGERIDTLETDLNKNLEALREAVQELTNRRDDSRDDHDTDSE